MQIKFFEIRDEGTCIPALAIEMCADERVGERFLWRCGYPSPTNGRPSVVLMRLGDQKATSDPYDWPALTGDRRTMPHAHDHIINNFSTLENGAVVDVRVILGETEEPARAEIAQNVPGTLNMTNVPAVTLAVREFVDAETGPVVIGPEPCE